MSEEVNDSQELVYLPKQSILGGGEDEVDSGPFPKSPDDEPTQELPIVRPLASEQPTQEVPIVTPPNTLPKGDLESLGDQPEDTRMKNVDKSHVEALAYGRSPSIPRHADTYAAESGNKYELQIVAERAGKSIEEIEEIINDDISASLTYGRQMIEHQLDFGEKLELNQEVFLAICKIADALREKSSSSLPVAIYRRRLYDNTLILIIGHDFAGRVVGSVMDLEVYDPQTSSTKIWTASPYRSTLVGGDLTYADNGVFTLVETTENEGKFIRVNKESVKPLDEDDVSQLKNLADSILLRQNDFK